MKPDQTILRDDLIRDEGQRLKPYVDTVGKTTIGVGRNLTDNGISADESMYLLINDLNAVDQDLTVNCSWWAGLPEPAARGLANMCFNLGWPRLSGFKHMLAALQAGEWETAATEAENSAWATQVGDRAHRIAQLFRSAVGPAT